MIKIESDGLVVVTLKEAGLVLGRHYWVNVKRNREWSIYAKPNNEEVELFAALRWRVLE